MKRLDIFPAWGRFLRGRKPLLSIEITRECPLRCPGCYAYEPDHLESGTPLRQLADYKGDALVNGVMALIRRYRPIHLSIVGGEPLVRYRELDVLLPALNRMNIEVQLVTSAVRPIPTDWAKLPNLRIVVSIDGLQPEHDRRRSPATYDRILQNISGHQITVHCTVTSQLLRRPDYLRDFAAFWSKREEVRKIWFSLFTPQKGEVCDERLSAADRREAVRQIASFRDALPKVDMRNGVLDGYLHPPESPEECIFAQATTCLSADLTTRITPCQFGGKPECSECGCIASAGLVSIGRYKLAGLVSLSSIFSLSTKIGQRIGRTRP